VLPSLRATPAIPAGLTRRRAARNPGTIDRPSDLFRLATRTVYGEPFTRIDAVAFATIWTALALYSGDALRLAWRSRAAEKS
jgi:hypothetical protein